ncbi:MAG: hypothetical protein E7573_09465 [Ruminococcaceae bacterium]|nr:hypothetical protein [Oscillospiraceae bacterium]MBR3595468.1 hypothetical protein [Clostridia bacterium]
MREKYILGLSAFYHNSAAALIADSKIIAAAEEERFTRIKGDSGFPINSIKFCLDKARIFPEDLECVVFYENPVRKFERIFTGAFLNAPKSITQFSLAMPDWITNKLWIEKTIRKELMIKNDVPVLFPEHHISHAASAFYPSPYEEAAIITIDGVGEWTTTAYGTGKKNQIQMIGECRYPNSLGLLYSAFTFYTGFKINNGEYKMMGLAPYGKPKYADIIKEKLVTIGEDGSILLNQQYFSFTYSMKTINKKFEELFGRKRRKPDEPITEFFSDIASSIQEVTNEIILKMAQFVRNKTNMKNLVMAGGVALNVTAIGELKKSGIFDSIWIQPAAGDSGAALGAAYYGYYSDKNRKRYVSVFDSMRAGYLGYSIENNSVEDDKTLEKLKVSWKSYSDEKLALLIAEFISKGKIVAIARGPAEFGPRALGNRSILADARDAKMLQRLNSKIKFREGFRPFAPAVIKEDASQFFDIEEESKYMLLAVPVKEERRLPLKYGKTLAETASFARSDIPAVTHIDYSARVQTVDKKDNPFFYRVLTEFKKLTGLGVVINTSFNIKGEPIVNNACDAYHSFINSGIDCVVIGNRIIMKDDMEG